MQLLLLCFYTTCSLLRLSNFNFQLLSIYLFYFKFIGILPKYIYVRHMCALCL